MSRPTDYSIDRAAEICAHIAQGKSLKSYCLQEDTPHIATIYRWIAAHEEFRDLYARAREDQADTIADEIIDIADTEPDHNKARVRIDARKWTASKLKPKRYGNEVEIGEGGGSVVVHVVTGVPRPDK